ncbi:unnamed protein product [Mucor hiemalis]
MCMRLIKSILVKKLFRQKMLVNQRKQLVTLSKTPLGPSSSEKTPKNKSNRVQTEEILEEEDSDSDSESDEFNANNNIIIPVQDNNYKKNNL